MIFVEHGAADRGIRNYGSPVQLVHTINHIFHSTHKSQILPACYESNVGCDIDMEGSEFFFFFLICPA